MEFLWEGLLSITWQQLLMYVVGGLADLAGHREGV